MVVAWAKAGAQDVSLGVQGALADYTDRDLFRGTGGGLTIWARLGHISAEGSIVRTSYHPLTTNFGLIGFKTTQLDARLGFDLAAGFTAEAGLMKRTVDRVGMQEVGSGRIGIRYSKFIGPGVFVGVRGNYLVAANFTGGGSADLAIELGLLASVAPRNGRYRFTMDYGFQRIDRKVSGEEVPIQQSLVRLGVAVRS
jgi:hypothetical protein